MNHIRNEIATRLHFKLMGVDRDLSELLAEKRVPSATGVPWCGPHLVHYEVFFNSIDHAISSLRHNGGIAVCPGCLRAVAAIIDKELGD